MKWPFALLHIIRRNVPAFIFFASLTVSCSRFAPMTAPHPTESRPTPTSRQVSAPSPTPSPTAAYAEEGRFAVDFRGEPSYGIVMEIPAFEIREGRVRIYVAFANHGERTQEFYAPLEPGESARLRAGDQWLEPTDMSENFREDICPEYPVSVKKCLWVIGSVERGWFEFQLPSQAPPPFEFRFPNLGRAKLTTDRPFAGEIWSEVPKEPFPQGVWRLDSSPLFAHLNIPSLRIRFREIRAGEDALTVTLELRQPKGLIVIGHLPGPGEMGMVDAAGHLAFPREFPQDMKEMVLSKDETRRVLTLVYPRPTAAGPLVFRIGGWPLMRFDPARETVEAAEWDGKSFVLAPTPTPSAERIAAQAIKALMARLTEAMRHKDVEAFREAFAEDAVKDWKLMERIVLGGGWPIADARWRVEGGNYEADRAKDVSIIMEVQLEGFSPEDVRRYRAEADFEKRGDAWRIVRYEWADVPPWVVLPGRAWTSDHFTLIGPDRLSDATAQEVLEELEAARSDLETRLPKEIFRPRYLALYAPDADTFRRLTGKDPQRTLGVAFFRTQPRIEDDEVVGFESGQFMIVLNAEGVRGYRKTDPLFGREAVLRHELVHVILAPWTRPWTPGWLVEGAAMAYADQPFWREIRNEKLESLGPMTYTVSFGHIGDIFGEYTARQYGLASAMAEFVRETWGDEAFLALYRAYAEIPPAEVERHLPVFGIGMLMEGAMESIARDATPDLMRRHLGVSPEEFERRFREWLARK